MSKIILVRRFFLISGKKKWRRNYSCGLFLPPNFQSYFVTFLKHPILVFGVEFGFWKLFLKLTLKNETWLAKIWIQKSKVNTNGSLETNTESQPDFCQLYRLVVTENYWPNLRLFTVDAHLLSIMVNISWTVGNSLLVYISVIWWFFFQTHRFCCLSNVQYENVNHVFPYLKMILKRVLFLKWCKQN